MKRTLLFVSAFASTFAFGQQVSDMVSLGAGYANESYYSFENGEVANVDDHNWHLAFDLSAFGATVRINGRDVELYDSGDLVADWANTMDTTGMASWERYTNGFDYWSEGALNNAAGSSPLDMGWGEYNTTTHQVGGTRLFALKFGNGDVKKLLIESLASGTYTVKHADLDGSNEVSQTIAKADYSDRNFIYYDVVNNTIADREPANDAWDIVFTNYVQELAPGYFGGLTGALHNNGVVVNEIDDQPEATSTYGSVWDTTIATIGYNWKTFNMQTFSYTIEDSLSYFVQLENGDIWKLVFTGFGGSTDGDIEFTKEQIEFAGVPTYEGANLEVYPNPANNAIKVNYTHDIASVRLTNMNGQVVIMQTSGMSSIDVSNLEEGIYFLQVSDDSGRTATTRVVIQH